jgi:hypothetical protein
VAKYTKKLDKEKAKAAKAAANPQPKKKEEDEQRGGRPGRAVEVL